MDCDRADLVIGLLEEELDPAEKAEVEAHLQGCVACRATRDAYVATLGDLRALPAERPTADAAARAYAAVVEAMASSAKASAKAAPAAKTAADAPAGKVLAFPAPRERGRRALVIQLAAAAACLLLVVALVAPDRHAREAAQAPMPSPAADAAPAAPVARPAPSLGKTTADPASEQRDLELRAGRRNDEALREAQAADDAEAKEEAQERALALERSEAEDEASARARLDLADARSARRAAAGESGGRPDTAEPAPQPPAAKSAVPAQPTTPPSAPPPPAPGGRGGDAKTDEGTRGAPQGTTEPLGAPDGAASEDGGVLPGATRGRQQPPAPPPPAPTEAPRAPRQPAPEPLAESRAKASSTIGAWRTTLDGEPLDVALLDGSGDAPPQVVVARRTSPRAGAGRPAGDAPAGASPADGASSNGTPTDAIELLDGASSSPDLARVLDDGTHVGFADRDEARGADAAKLRKDAAQDPTRRRLLLALLAHEVAEGHDPTASRPEATAIARAERVAALLAALDGRPVDRSAMTERAGREGLLRLARERVERDMPAPRRSAR